MAQGEKPAGKVSREDRDLFREAMADARPLARDGNRASKSRERPAPEPRHSLAGERAVLDVLLDAPEDERALDSAEIPEYLRSGLQHRVLRRLKRGQFTVGDELDLHHLHVPQARRCLEEFLADCRGRGVHCVRVIHGKGRRSSGGEPVLRRFVAGFLRRHRDVLAFSAARPSEGGSGALVVLLRR